MPAQEVFAFFWGLGEKIQDLFCGIYNLIGMSVFQFFFGAIAVGNRNALKPCTSCAKHVMLFVANHHYLIPMFRKPQPFKCFLNHFRLIGSAALRLTSYHLIKIRINVKMLCYDFHKNLWL